MNRKTIELDIPIDPAERVRRQDEYHRMKAPLPAWLGPDTPERREELQMFVQMMDDPAFNEEPTGERISEDDPAILKGMITIWQKRAELAETELDELKKIAPAHRTVLPVVTMQGIADAIVKSAAEFPSSIEGADPHELIMITPGKLKNIIMREFDKEIG